MNRGTVIIHSATASNDVTDDNGWEGITVAVALNHDTYEVIDADISEALLTKRLERDGWTVLHEDDEFVHDGSRWVRNPETSVTVLMWGGYSYAHGDPETFHSMDDAVAEYLHRMRRGYDRRTHLQTPTWGDAADDEYVIMELAGGDAVGGLTLAEVLSAEGAITSP